MPISRAGTTLWKGGFPPMNVLKSRKFWAAAAALILSVISAYVPDFPLDSAQFEQLIVVLAAYILGTALEDGLRTTRS
jgi:hypothetical protein